MSLRTVLATALSIGLLAPIAFAQSPQPPGPQGSPGQRARGISITLNARQRLQMRRIRTGRERGAIDRAEFGRLVALERAIRVHEQRLRTSDGALTVRERLRLQRELNRAGRAIRRAGRGRR